MILELLQGDGNVINRVATTGGGEYAGACPFCGGHDRFRVWPEQGEHGRWWCRQCGRRGDAIQYLRDVRKMGFREAAEYVGKEISSFTPSLGGRKVPRSHWAPRGTSAPAELWQEQARRLVEESEHWLFQPFTFGQKMLGWLKEKRGLSEETIKAHRLGLVPIDRFDNYEEWGFKPVLKDNGKLKKIWIPKGLAIPFCQDGKIYRIRIRRPKSALRSEIDPPYYLLKGSDTRALVLGQDREIKVLVESELDAILLSQEAGDLVGVIPLGNAQTRPDKEAMEALGNSKLILVALDADGAGTKEAWQWWIKHFSKTRRWPPVEGKDPGDMWAAGINIRDWIRAGIDEYSAKIGAAVKQEEGQQACIAEKGPSDMQSTPLNSSSADNIAQAEEYGQQIPLESMREGFHMSEAIKAIHELALMGHRAWVVGNNIRLQHKGEGKIDPTKVAPLIDLVRQSKEEVLFFLKCHCPRCGGVVFIPDPEGRSLCSSCEWEYLTEVYPGLTRNHLKGEPKNGKAPRS
jgi:DNA primase